MDDKKSPDFTVIGAQRCGTTSLYNYLIQHPDIKPAIRKEIHFFDNNYHKGIGWYHKHFNYNKGKIVGEATPYYIFHPHAPYRIKNDFPKIKLIILLRNPIDRTFSHYNHEIEMGVETLTFLEAIKEEGKRLQYEEQKMLKNENYYSFNHQHFSYISRGIYVYQLEKWLNLFSKDQMKIFKSEEFFKNPKTVTSEIFKFLELDDFTKINFKIHRKLNYNKLNPETREELEKYFDQYNEKLYDLLEQDFMW